MHQALAIDEILEIIFTYFNPLLDRKFLAMSARTCQSFAEPALNALWKHMRGIVPLKRIIQWHSVDPTRPAFDRFNTYAGRIQSLVYSEHSHFDQYFFDAIRSLEGPTLPHLHTLDWTLSTSNGVAPLMMILHPQLPWLKRLRLSGWKAHLFTPSLGTPGNDHQDGLPFDDRLTALLWRLGRMAALKHVDLRLQDLSLESERAVGEALGELSELQSLKLGMPPRVCQKATRGAAKFGQLEELQVSFLPHTERSYLDAQVEACDDLEEGHSNLVFARLHSVDISGQFVEILRYFRAFPSHPHLQHITIQPCPTRSNAALLLQTLETLNPSFDVKTIKVTDQRHQFCGRGCNEMCLLSTLRPLLIFSQLEELIIDVTTVFDMTDQDLETLVVSWPRMRVLWLAHRKSRTSSMRSPWCFPRLTFRGVSVLANLCPRLRELALRINASDEGHLLRTMTATAARQGNEPQGEDGYSNTLEIWNIGGSHISPVADYYQIARIIQKIFPTIKNIIVPSIPAQWRESQSAFVRPEDAEERDRILTWEAVSACLTEVRN